MTLCKSGKVKDSHFLNQFEKDHSPAGRQTLTPLSVHLKAFDSFGWTTPTIPRYSGSVNLYDGVLISQAHDDVRPCKTVSFTPRDYDSLCIKLTAKKSFNYFWDFYRPANDELCAPTYKYGDGILTMVQPLDDKDRYCVLVKLVCADGEAPVLLKGSTLTAKLKTASDVFAVITVKTSRKCADPESEARLECERLSALGFDEVYAEHTQKWHEFWNKSFAVLTSEPELQKRFAFAQYTLGCTFGTSPMPSLSGLAYGPLDEQYHGCDYPFYTHDQNVQIALMGALPTNHTDMVLSMADTYLAIADKLRAFTKEVFGTRGICLPLSMSVDGSAMGGEYRYTLCGSAYSGMLFVMAWRYGRDKKALKEKYYPLLKELVDFYTDLMHKDENGVYHLDYTVPPEIFTFTRDDTCTLALLKPCIETCIYAVDTFEYDTDTTLWQDIIDHYPPFARRSDGGWWCGPDIPEDHYMFGGHLFYPFFPSETEARNIIALKTLKWYEKNARELNRYGSPACGWSAFNSSVVKLRLRLPDSFKCIYDFIELFGKENGLYTHNAVDKAKAKVIDPDVSRLLPPVIEGSSAVVFMTCEALLHTTNGVLHVFPDVPENFTGEFSNMLTSEGLTVSAKMCNGEIKKLTVFSEVTTVACVELYGKIETYLVPEKRTIKLI